MKDTRIDLLVEATFDDALASNDTFERSRCMLARFDNADLSMSSFWRANAKGASFNGANLLDVDFSRANLQEADLTNTGITDGQLLSALSIRDARLPNGTLGRDRSLIENGHADCRQSPYPHWQWQTGQIIPVVSGADLTECHFTVPANTTEASMSQRIDLTRVWDSTFWVSSRAVLYARMAGTVSVQMSATNSSGSVLDKKILSKIEL